MSNLRRGLGLGVVFGLAAATVDTWLGLIGVMQRRIGGAWPLRRCSASRSRRCCGAFSGHCSTSGEAASDHAGGGPSARGRRRLRAYEAGSIASRNLNEPPEGQGPSR